MVYLAIVSLIWAFSFGLIGNALQGLDSLYVAGLRLLSALVVFLPFLRFKALSPKAAAGLVLCGALQFGLMYVCYLSAFRFIPSHLVALFSVLTPVYVVIIHDLRARVLNPKYLWAASLSVAGAVVIKAQTGGANGILVGFGLMQIAGLAFASGQVYYREWKMKNEAAANHEVFALLYLGATLFAWVAYAILRGDGEPAPAVSGTQWTVILYLGIVASGLGFFLWNVGASKTSPGVLAAFNNVVVPLAMFASLFVFGEAEGASGDQILRLAIGSILIGSAVALGLQQKRPAT